VKDSARRPDFDVARAVVLLGVFTMNYVVVWNLDEIRSRGWSGIAGPELLREMFDPWKGPLATRFAATLSTLVGVGVALLSARAVASDDREAIRQDRWRLRRRGLLFMFVGIFFEAVWPGEILHFTGVYLILAAWVIRWRRSALLIGAVAVAALTAIQRIAVFQQVGQQSSAMSWWGGYSEDNFTRSIGNPRGFMSNILSWGGHPVLPWFAFVLIGIALGRTDLSSRRTKLYLIAGGATAGVLGYLGRAVGKGFVPPRWEWTMNTEPGGFGRISPFGLGMPMYVITTAGTSTAALVLLVWMSQRTSNWLLTRLLAHAGQMTFTSYLLHGLIPWFTQDQDWLGSNYGLVGSLAIAVSSWLGAVVLGGLYHHYVGRGPMEWLLRQVGGDTITPGRITPGHITPGHITPGRITPEVAVDTEGAQR
jgi:uncharacterized protein